MLLLLALFSVAFSKFELNTTDFPFWYKSLSVGTWNVMMQPWFIWKEQAEKHLLAHHHDVLALQEVWTAEDRERILNLPGVKHRFPYHFYVQPNAEPRVGCNFADPVLLQMATNWIGLLQLTGTNTQQLQQPLAGPMCYNCSLLAVGIALHNYDPVSGIDCLACLINSLEYLPEGPAAFGALEQCGLGQGPKYGHKGSNGQLILSKYPIEDVKVTTFSSFIAHRANIHATIRGFRMSFGHWAFNLLEDIDPSLAPFMTGDLQVQMAADFVAQGSDVLLGDWNSGYNYQPAGYNHLIANGYKSFFETQPDTWCRTSHADFLPCIHAGVPPGAPDAIDHILVKSNSKVRIHSASLFNDRPTDMSDHTGVQAELRKCWFSAELEAKIEEAKARAIRRS